MRHVNLHKEQAVRRELPQNSAKLGGSHASVEVHRHQIIAILKETDEMWRHTAGGTSLFSNAALKDVIAKKPTLPCRLLESPDRKERLLLLFGYLVSLIGSSNYVRRALLAFQIDPSNVLAQQPDTN
jgi:hypothetical protein